jgi:hypothetical protein
MQASNRVTDMSISSSDKERSRGDVPAWGTDGKGGVGTIAGNRVAVKFVYDCVFDAITTNKQVKHPSTVRLQLCYFSRTC